MKEEEEIESYTIWSCPNYIFILHDEPKVFVDKKFWVCLLYVRVWQNICLNKIEWVWEWGVGVCIQFVFITQWKLLWMIFTSLINICSKKRNTTNDGNGTCTHVINAFYTFNMTFSNKMSWTKLNLVFTTAIFKKTFLVNFLSPVFINCYFDKV